MPWVCSWLLRMSVVVKQKLPHSATPVFFCLISNNSTHICPQFMPLQSAYRLHVSSFHASSTPKTRIRYTSLLYVRGSSQASESSNRSHDIVFSSFLFALFFFLPILELCFFAQTTCVNINDFSRVCIGDYLKCLFVNRNYIFFFLFARLRGNEV